MEVQLEQSPFLSLISEDRTQQVLQLMGKPADTKITTQIAREICERTGSTAVLSGSIASSGASMSLGCMRLIATLERCWRKSKCRQHRKEDVLDALGQAASKFRAPARRIAGDDRKAQHAARGSQARLRWKL